MPGERRRIVGPRNNASNSKATAMRPVNPCLVVLKIRPKRCEIRVSEGDLGYLTHVPDDIDEAVGCVAVRFPYGHMWVALDSINFLVFSKGETFNV